MLAKRPWCATALVAAIFLTACGGGSGNQSQLASGAGNSPQTFNALAVFDPVPVNPQDAPAFPFPFDGLFAGFNDPTLNIPNSSNVPFVTAANLTDGFSTVASQFFDMTGFVDFSTITPNLLIINSATGAVLQPGVDYTLQGAAATSPDLSGVARPIQDQRTRVLIEPLKPLAPSTRYLVALKASPKTTDGNSVIASAAFRVVRSATPVSQQSEPILASYNESQKATLEQLRAQVIRPVVAAIEQAAGLGDDQILLAWSFTTGSTDKTLKALAANPTVGTLQVQNTGKTTQDAIGVAGADIYAGTATVPYYLGNSGGDTHSTVPLSTFWAADASKPDTSAKFLGQVPCGAFAIGATLPDGQTAKPSASTTVCFPLPVKKTTETIPLLVTVPTGQTKPAKGWPVVLFAHGITGDRTQMLAIAPALAQAGFVVVAIDLPLHGLPSSSPFYRNQLFAGTPASGLMTGERTFDLDLVNNTTGAAGPDGTTDSSGTHFINLTSLITSRDNLRQAVSDFVTLTASLGKLDLDHDGIADIDTTQVRFAGLSLGSIVGGTFMGVNTSVGAATLAVPGGAVAKLLDASKTFGPRISAGLAASGVVEGTDTYETFLRFAQQLVDAGDPINYATAARANHPLHLIEVVNDTVVPNAAKAGPASATQDLVTVSSFLAGTDPYVASLGLDVIGPLTPPVTTASIKTGAKLGAVTVFAIGKHGSLLDPSGSAANAAVTQEMQRETVNFLKSNGQCLPVGGNCQ